MQVVYVVCRCKACKVRWCAFFVAKTLKRSRVGVSVRWGNVWFRAAITTLHVEMCRIQSVDVHWRQNRQLVGHAWNLLEVAHAFAHVLITVLRMSCGNCDMSDGIFLAMMSALLISWGVVVILLIQVSKMASGL